MTKYVLGFLFNHALPTINHKVVLIKKRKPDWMRGKLNGVGGKIEEGETGFEAMVREFKEETGQDYTDWNRVGGIRVQNEAFVYVYVGSNEDIVEAVRTTTDETVIVPLCRDLHQMVLMPNLPTWLTLAIACRMVNIMGKAWESLTIEE